MVRNCVLCFCILLLSCKSASHFKSSYIYQFPEYDSGRIVDTFNEKYYKINYKDAVIYELPYHYLYQPAPATEFQDSLKYRYFIFGEHDKYGYTIMSRKDKFSRRQEVDSVLKSSALKTLDIDTFFRLLTMSNTQRINEHILIMRGKVEATGYDSIYFYYDDRLMDLNYELSGKLDAANKSKLFKVELVPKKEAVFYNGYLYHFGIISYEIGKVKINNVNEIELLYKRFKNEAK